MAKVIFKMHECANLGFGEIYADGKLITTITGIKEIDIRQTEQGFAIFIDSTLLTTQLFFIDNYELEENANEYCNVIIGY